jgi:hypothetical protein
VAASTPAISRPSNYYISERSQYEPTQHSPSGRCFDVGFHSERFQRCEDLLQWHVLLQRTSLLQQS